MGDLFHDLVSLDFIEQVFGVMREANPLRTRTVDRRRAWTGQRSKTSVTPTAS